jgi:hypothetical protein
MGTTRNVLLVAVFALNALSAWPARSNADSESLSGADLDQVCAGRQSQSDADVLCNTYVHGFLDGFNAGASLPRPDLSYCPPRNLTVASGRLIITKYMRDHPTELDLDAGSIAARAMQAAYPCSKG